MSIDFWFSIGSTYSYFTVMRLAEVAAATGIDFVWRPFNVRAIMIAQNNIPFANKPVKAAYIWRDIARHAAKYGLSPNSPHPIPSLICRWRTRWRRSGWPKAGRGIT